MRIRFFRLTTPLKKNPTAKMHGQIIDCIKHERSVRDMTCRFVKSKN